MSCVRITRELGPESTACERKSSFEHSFVQRTPPAFQKRQTVRTGQQGTPRGEEVHPRGCDDLSKRR